MGQQIKTVDWPLLKVASSVEVLEKRLLRPPGINNTNIGVIPLNAFWLDTSITLHRHSLEKEKFQKFSVWLFSKSQLSWLRVIPLFFTSNFFLWIFLSVGLEKHNFPWKAAKEITAQVRPNVSTAIIPIITFCSELYFVYFVRTARIMRTWRWTEQIQKRKIVNKCMKGTST